MMQCEAINYYVKLHKELKDTPLESNIMNLLLRKFPCVRKCVRIEFLKELRKR